MRQVTGEEESGRHIFSKELTVRCNMNLGFYCMQAGRYAEAAQYYRKSMGVDIRLATEKERYRRDFLTRYCLARAGLLFGTELGSLNALDLLDTRSDPIAKPYDMQLLALYFN
jgi:hypothetical protein